MEKEENNQLSLQIDEQGFLNEIRKIANSENFLGFLNLCAHNITMSFRNQIALYGQNKDIYNACGIKAKKEYNSSQNIELNPETLASATVLYYRLQYENNEYKPEYLPIRVIGDTPQTFNTPSLANVVPDMVAKTGVTVEVVPKACLKHPANKADYNLEGSLIQVANNLTQAQYGEALISTFTKLCLQAEGNADKILQMSVSYVVSEYFGLPQKGVHGVLFNQAFAYPVEEFAELLEQISTLSFGVVETLIGKLVSFDETSIINTYFNSNNFDSFSQKLRLMEHETDDERTIKLLSNLADKFDESTNNSINYLLSQKESKGAVYTYPPFRFERIQDSEVTGG